MSPGGPDTSHCSDTDWYRTITDPLTRCNSIWSRDGTIPTRREHIESLTDQFPFDRRHCQTQNSFSSMKIFTFWLKFHWSLSPMVHLPGSQHWSWRLLGLLDAMSFPESMLMKLDAAIYIYIYIYIYSLQWRHNGRDGVSNHLPPDCLLTVYSAADQRKHQSSASLSFVRGIHRSPVIPVQMASNAENVSIWWRHHAR